jgi:hypothetical protein
LRLILRLPHFADEADTLAGKCADEVLTFAIIADRAAGRVDTGSQRRFRDDAPTPDRLKHVVLADNTVAIADQEFQKVEDLGLDGTNGFPAAELTPTRIEDVAAEKKKHFQPNAPIAPILPSPRRRWSFKTPVKANQDGLKEKSR